MKNITNTDHNHSASNFSFPDFFHHFFPVSLQTQQGLYLSKAIFKKILETRCWQKCFFLYRNEQVWRTWSNL